MELSSSQQSVLSKGPNFVIAPKKIPVPYAYFMASIEKGFWTIPPDFANDVSQKTVCLLKKAKLPNNNISPDDHEGKTLKQLYYSRGTKI